MNFRLDSFSNSIHIRVFRYKLYCHTCSERRAIAIFGCPMRQWDYLNKQYMSDVSFLTMMNDALQIFTSTQSYWNMYIFDAMVYATPFFRSSIVRGKCPFYDYYDHIFNRSQYRHVVDILHV